MGRVTINGLPLKEFSGGLNLRDAWAEIANNESPLCYNVVFDERGAVAARLGIVNLNAASLLPQAPGYLYYSKVADALLAYISADAGNGKLYKSTNGGVTWSSVYTGFTTGALGAIVDFNNTVAVVNTLDGVYSFSSALGAPTHTAGGTNNMDEVRGSAIANWKNRLLVGGDIRNDATHSPARLYACKPGDPTTWNDATESWTNDLREIDDAGITTLGPGQGVDYQLKPTLYVCKQNSVYRVNDDATGSYTTLHSSGAGAGGVNSIAAVLGRIVTINDQGMWVSDGIQVPVRVSDKIAPLFQSDLDLSTTANWAGGIEADRVKFNVTRSGSSTNNLQIEYHPLVGWITVHKGMALGPMTVYTKGVRQLMAGSASSGKVYRVSVGGTDDGTSISCFWSSKDFPLLSGREARLRNLRLWGRGTYDIRIRMDYERGQGDSFSAAFSSGGFVWDVDRWDIGIWGDTVFLSDQEFPLEEVGRHCQLAVAATVSSTTQGVALLDDGVQPEVGSWALYEALLQSVPVGLG